MRTLIKTLLITIIAVSGSYTTHSCSNGSLKKGCKKAVKHSAIAQVTDEGMGIWQLTTKFNY